MAATPLVYSRFKAPEAANGTLDVYEAGSLQTRKTTYSSPNLTGANANPVELNSLGEADIFYSGLARLVLKDENGDQIWDKDNIGLSGDTSTQYVNSLSATYSSSTQFTLSGDQTTEYHVNRIVRLTGSSTAYGRITASSYSNPNTTVTVVLSSGTLDATLATAATSVIGGDSSSGVPFSHIQGSDVASVAGTTVLDTVIGDYCVITGTNTITAFTLTKGRHIFCRAGGAFSMTHGASLILPNGNNITAISGDTFLLVGEASGVVRCLFYNRAASISGYVAGARTYLREDGAAAAFDVATNVTETTGTEFESVGPTGSSATNEWAAMNAIPAGARIVILGVYMTSDTNAADAVQTLFVYARATGGNSPAGPATMIAHASFVIDDNAAQDAAMFVMAMVPLDSSRRFDIAWSATNDTSRTINIYVKGFIV